MAINLTEACAYLCQFGNNEASIDVIIDCCGIRTKATLVIRKLACKLIRI